MYELREQDIDAYLASKRDEDIIGMSQHGGRCLLANTLRWKYHSRKAGIADGKGEVRGDEFPLSRELIAVYHRFDAFGLERPVTKREWLAACEKVGEGERRP